MNEIEAIVQLAREVEPDEAMAMATVVEVHGSAYRRPGARMLMTQSGRTVGMISGGCLEADVRERGRQVMASNTSRVVTYDSTAPEDIVFGLGLGCNGVVNVLIEPVSASDPVGLLAFLAWCHAHQATGSIATLIRTDPSGSGRRAGARLLYWPDGRITGDLTEPGLLEPLKAAACGTSSSRTWTETITSASAPPLSVLFETIAPPVSLVVFGAGDDALPVVRAAKGIGWKVTVVDPRPAYAQDYRFPLADAVHCVRAERLVECCPGLLTPDTVTMVMTHSYTTDRELLRVLLPRALRYVGLLGPRARSVRLLNELADEGCVFDSAMLASLYSPAGIDIGAETAEEIAISVIAEMRAVLSGRTGGALRDRAGAIHEP